MHLHNHPDVYDKLDLSIENFDFTNRLYHACLPFGMEIIDHIILTDNTYYGFDKNGYMGLIHDHLKYKTYNNIKPRIEQEKEDCRNEGIVISEERGKKVGLKKGEKEGKYEGEIEIAKSMLADNIDIKIIFKHTGFSEK